MSDENLLALQTICSSIQTLLGPSKSLKCCLSNTSSENELISDPLRLVEALVGGVSRCHPVVEMVHEACQDQWKACGCGITTLVVMATYWAKGIARLVHEGIPAPVVFDVFDEVLTLCENTLLTLQLPLKSFQNKTTTGTLPSDRRHIQAMSQQARMTELRGAATGEAKASSTQRKSRVMVYSRHFSASSSQQLLTHEKGKTESSYGGEDSRPTWIEVIGEKLSSGKPVAMQLAVDVVKIHLSAVNEIQMRRIFRHSTLGKEERESQVVRGLVMDLNQDMLPVVNQHQRNLLRVVVINGDCTPGHTHLGLQKRTRIKSHDLGQLYECSSKVKWLQECTKVLSKLEVGVVVVGGAVSPSLLEHGIANGIVILRGVAKQQLEGVCQLTGATPLSYLTNCLERHVGCQVVTLEAEEWGWSKPSVRHKGQKDWHFERRYICMMKSPVPGVIATVLLCGKTESLVKLIEHQFLNCLNRLKLAVGGEGGSLVPGGGTTEAVCVSKLRQKLLQLNYELSETDSSSPDQKARRVNTLSFAMATSWMSDYSLLVCWRPHVYEVCASGFMEYIARVLINSSCSASSYVAMVSAEEFVTKAEMAGEKGFGSLHDLRVLDVAKSKLAAWRRAVDLLRLVFLSVNVQAFRETTVV